MMKSDLPSSWDTLNEVLKMSTMIEMALSISKTILLEGCPAHWTLKDALGEPNWEDWRDFLRLNRKMD